MTKPRLSRAQTAEQDARILAFISEDKRPPSEVIPEAATKFDRTPGSIYKAAARARARQQKTADPR